MSNIDQYIGKIICGDCLEIMQGIPDNSVDLIVTDPPYGIKEDSYRQKSRSKLAKTTDYGRFNWDKKIEKIYFDEMLRVSKNQIIFGGIYYTDYLPSSRCWIVWDKDNSGDFADCELAWTSFDSAVKMYKYRWNGMLQEKMGKQKETRYYPTQKPLQLFKWILRDYAKESDIILDPFLGGGTTMIACEEMGIKCFGIDKRPEAVDISRSRVDAVINQGKLFT